MYNGSKEEIDKLCHLFSSFHNNIKFTSEHESNRTINFLDLSIQVANGKQNFNIYRKKTATDRTIHKTSCHPNSQKMAAFRFMINRALQLPISDAHLKEEMELIKGLAYKNGYSPVTIEKMCKNITRKLNKPGENHKNTTKQDIKYYSLPFLGNMSYQIARIFSKHNINIAFSTKNKIGHVLPHNITKNDTFQQTGVYKIKCQECESCYVGQTGRGFRIRFNEHMTAHRLENYSKSAVATHMQETGHKVNNIENALTVLHRQVKSRKLDILEAIAIYKHQISDPENLLNDRLDSEYNKAITLFGKNCILSKQNVQISDPT